MHGSIILTSTPSAGTTATFTLPLKVNAWSGDAPLAKSSLERQHLAQSLPRGSTHRDILNQQISDIVTSGHNPPHPDSLEKQPIEPEGGVSALTTDQRSLVHVLLVEDKYGTSILSSYYPNSNLWLVQCNKSEDSAKNHP